MSLILPEQRKISEDTRLSLAGISKRFGGVRAIREADFQLLPGEVHALVGENGAGKSTLIKIISGAEIPDTGKISIDGEVIDIKSASDALNLGIATVYQEAQLFAQLTVAENVFLGREITRGKRIDWVAEDNLVREALETVGLDESYIHRKIEDLPAGQQQQVSIAKALVGDARILILDEPSAILTDAEIDNLFAAIHNLTARGVSVIYISHRLDELAQIADVVTIMRDGVTLGTYPVGALSVTQIAETMVGGQFEQSLGTQNAVKEQVALAVSDLTSYKFRDVSFDVRVGEVVVLYGLIGSGMSEIVSSLYGKETLLGGSVELNGKPYRPTSPTAAKAQGLFMLPANRKKEGMFSFQSIAFNISIGSLKLMSKWGAVFDRKKEVETANELIKKLSIKTPSQKKAVSTLSGGNAQKVVLARQLVQRPSVLVLAEPTQGVDIGAKEEIHRIIAGLCEEGTAVLVTTSDLEEARRIANRLIVIRDGMCFAEFGPRPSQAKVLAAASGQLTEEGLGEEK